MEESKYKRWLVALRKDYEEISSFSLLTRRFAIIKLVLDFIEVNGRFQYLLKVLEEKLSLDIDRDVDYLEWSKNEAWPNTFLKNTYNEDLVKNSLSVILGDKKMTQSFANKVTGYFANVDKESNEDRFGISDAFRQSLEAIGSDRVRGEDVFETALIRARTELQQTLLKVHETLNAVHSNNLYANFYESLCKQSFYHPTVNSAKSDYEHWRDHEIYQELNVEELINRRTKYIALFLSSGFLKPMDKTITKRDKTVAESEIDTVLLDSEVPEGTKTLNLFCRFKCFFSFNGSLIERCEKSILGKYIFDHRKKLNENDLDALFRFEKLLEFLQEDIKSIIACDGLIFPENFDFDHTIFHPNLNVKAVFLALHKMRNKGLLNHKAYWFVVYRYFLDDNWIKKGRPKFCSLINNIFPDLNLKVDANFKKINSYYENTPVKDWKNNERKPIDGFADYKAAADWMTSNFDKKNFLLPGRAVF